MVLRILLGWCTVDVILLRILLGWCTVDIILLRILLVWCTVDIIPLSIVLLRILLGWCTVDIILLSIVLLRILLGWCIVDIHGLKDTAWVVHSGCYPLKDILLGWCTVDIILLRILLVWCTVDIIPLSIVLLGYCLGGAQWISSSPKDTAWVVHSGYHPLEDTARVVHSGYDPLKHRPLRIMLRWCTVDIVLLSIILFGYCLGGAHCGYHPLKDTARVVHSGYHPLKHRPLRILLRWCTVDIILLSIVLLGYCLGGAQWISSS